LVFAIWLSSSYNKFCGGLFAPHIVQLQANRLGDTHDKIDIGQSGKSSFFLLSSLRASSKIVCSPEPEVSFKPPAVCRVTGNPFSSMGSQLPVPGRILIREGVDAPVSWVLPSRLTQNPT